MHTLTRKQRLNKRKGKMGSGWGKKNRRPSAHIFTKERWFLTPFNGHLSVYFTEKQAVEVATAIATRTNTNVEVDHQIMNDLGEWIAPE